MLARLLAWFGSSTLGAIAVLIALGNGLSPRETGLKSGRGQESRCEATLIGANDDGLQGIRDCSDPIEADSVGASRSSR